MSERRTDVVLGQVPGRTPVVIRSQSPGRNGRRQVETRANPGDTWSHRRRNVTTGTSGEGRVRRKGTSVIVHKRRRDRET